MYRGFIGDGIDTLMPFVKSLGGLTCARRFITKQDQRQVDSICLLATTPGWDGGLFFRLGPFWGSLFA